MDGATTVASTAHLASLAGVRVFVTGGIGGVHRGAEATFDVSADLVELGRTPVVVVCSGVKSILDVEKTLEVGEFASPAVPAWTPAPFAPPAAVLSAVVLPFVLRCFP